jgi:hypothetical protein
LRNGCNSLVCGVRKMKPWYKSKTIVVNVVAAALVALEAVSGLLQPYLPVDLYTAVAVGLPVVNAMLRVITYEAVT